MSSLGFSNTNGSLLTGFDHVRQSISVILNTPVGTRVMRREFGSELLSLVDKPMNDRIILGIYSACAMAIARWEPRFALTSINVTDASMQGVINLDIRGVYYPNGHKGDFTTSEGEITTNISVGGSVE